MLPKNDKILDFDDIRILLCIVLLNMRQYLNFDKGLLIKLRFIGNEFDGRELLLLMIKNLDNLTITSLPHLVQNLIPKCNMIINLINILLSKIIKNLL